MESNYFTSDQPILDKLKWVKMKFLYDRYYACGMCQTEICHFYVQTKMAKYL